MVEGSQIVNLLHSGFNVTYSPNNENLIVSVAPIESKPANNIDSSDLTPPQPTTQTNKPNVFSIGIPALIIGLGIIYLVFRR